MSSGLSEALVGLGGVALGGVLGFAGTIRAARIAGQQQRDLATDDRRQRRREEAYVTLMEFANWSSVCAELVLRRERGELLLRDQEMPTAPENRDRLAALVLSYGTPSAVADLQRLNEAASGFDQICEDIKRRRAGAEAVDLSQLELAYDRVDDASGRLRDQIRIDLGLEALPQTD